MKGGPMTLLEYLNREVCNLSVRVKYEKNISSQSLRAALMLLTIAKAEPTFPQAMKDALHDLNDRFDPLGASSKGLRILAYLPSKEEQKPV